MIRLATTADAEAVLRIYAPIVRETPISFEWEVPSVAEIAARIEKVLATRPWLIFEREGDVLGYVYASTYRDRLAYQWGPEVTVYIRADARGLGLGRGLYTALFDVLRAQGYCTVVAGATVPNAGSEGLHQRMGFQEFGRYPAAGYKFGKWHDVVFWYLRLCELPSEPRTPKPLNDVIDTQEWRDALAHGASLIRGL